MFQDRMVSSSGAGPGALTWLSVPVSLFIGTVGAVSVFKG